MAFLLQSNLSPIAYTLVQKYAGSKIPPEKQQWTMEKVG
jgi:hypothetical protein